MRIGFIGAGNMGGAVLRAAVCAGLAAPEEIFFCRRHPDALRNRNGRNLSPEGRTDNTGKGGIKNGRKAGTEPGRNGKDIRRNT